MSRPLVMGVLNVTPDSFFDGGRYLDHRSAIRHGLTLVEEGADIVDVGGESSRPGADPVPEDEELRRVLPVVSALAGSVRVSIDTVKPAVARAAVSEGATLVNDVGGSLIPLAASLRTGLVVMHRQGSSKDMQVDPRYDDVVAEVGAFLAGAAAAARSAGVTEVYVDPGIGFGKTVRHNLELLAALSRLVGAGEPVLVGVSRKAFLGRVASRSPGTPLGPEDRFEASLAAAVCVLSAGAAVVRVHDVAATVAAARIVGSDVARAAGARV